MAYPMVIVMVAIVPAAILLGWRDRGLMGRLLPALAVVLLGAAGVFGAGLVFRLGSGRWDAYFLIQRNFGRGWNNPVAVAVSYFHSNQIGNAWSVIPAVLLVVTAVAVCVRTREFDAENIAILLFGIALLVVPLIVGPRNAAYRSYGLMVPLVLLILRASERWRIVLVIACAVVSGVLAYAFFRGALI
jgi:hypothetical protein